MGAKFTTREWILILVLVCAGWLSLLIATLLCGSNSEIVSNVSFASSAISIILAVIAIIYTVTQGIAQTTYSSNISKEVGKLSQSVTEVNKSTENLKQLENLNELNKLQDLKFILEEFRDKIEANLQTSEITQKEISDFRKEFSENNIANEINEKKEKSPEVFGVNDSLLNEKQIEYFYKTLTNKDFVALVIIFYFYKNKVRFIRIINENLVLGDKIKEEYFKITGFKYDKFFYWETGEMYGKLFENYFSLITLGLVITEDSIITRINSTLLEMFKKGLDEEKDLEEDTLIYFLYKKFYLPYS